MQTATISAKFQICIPKHIRDTMDIQPGQVYIFLTKGDCIELVPKRNINDLRGLLKGANVQDVRDRSDNK